MIICGYFVAMDLMGKAKDKTIILIQLVLVILYWIFWLAAAAAVSNTTAWANSWYGSLNDVNCDTINSVFVGGYYWCGAINAVPILRALCAFCWLTFFLWSVSLFFVIYYDVMKDKALSSNKGAAATTAPAPTAAATTTEAVADAAAKV